MKVVTCLLASALAVSAGCERLPHDMSTQARHNPGSTSLLFADRQAERAPAEGTVAHAGGDLASISSGRAGLVPDVAPQTVPATTAASLARGGARYAIYCLPCHGEQGNGDGEVVRRGFPAPPPLASAALSDASDQRLHDAILQGIGTMYPFADRVSVADAWSIVAYVRRLQQQAGAVARPASASGAAR
jgi:mono/diheme cytochrome c family protein